MNTADLINGLSYFFKINYNKGIKLEITVIMMRMLELTDQIFGELTVIKRTGSLNGHSAWLCQCSCGKQAIVSSNKLVGGKTVSCGHLKTDVNHTGLRTGYAANKVNGVAVFLLKDTRKVRSDSSTGVTGVKVIHYRDGSARYAADITIKGKRTRIGTFATVKEATKARQNAVKSMLN